VPQRLLEEAKVKGKAMHEGWRVRKDMTMFWGSVVITALHDDDNTIIGFSKVTRDLTERKLAEEKMKDYARELEFQNQELQQFAFAAAHDMKEPLRKIQLYTTSILNNLSGQIPEKERDYLARSAEAVSRMQRLIDDILTYSRTSVGNEAMELVDLQQLLTEVRGSYLESMSETKAVIEFHQLPTVPGIPFQLRQLFDNIIGNALKYRHPDRTPHVTLTCEKIASPFFTGDRQNTSRNVYKISVKDNGIGFEQKYAEKIFEMFNRLHTRYNYPGTGIGLALCRKIVQNHKGNLTATGTPNQGATFHIFLPI
jgi:light-regulated signal transduction histidine kinase (bacteriophytochrome)